MDRTARCRRRPDANRPRRAGDRHRQRRERAGLCAVPRLWPRRAGAAGRQSCGAAPARRNPSPPATSAGQGNRADERRQVPGRLHPAGTDPAPTPPRACSAHGCLRASARRRGAPRGGAGAGGRPARRPGGTARRGCTRHRARNGALERAGGRATALRAPVRPCRRRCRLCRPSGRARDL